MKDYYLNVYNKSKDELFLRINKSLNDQEKEFIITANSEIFMEGLNNPIVDEFLKDKKVIVTADGISIVRSAKYFGINIKEKIVGVDICKYLLDTSCNQKYNVYVYGAKEEVLKKLKDVYPNVKFVALKNGYDNKDGDVKKDIIAKKPDIIIAALGVPKQELFLNDLYNNLKKGIFIGVGGSIDVLSGSKKRAPKIFIKTNTEWLYRIIREPKRLKRFWNNNVKLMHLAKKESR